MAWLDDQIAQYAQSPAVAGAVGSLLSLRWMPGSSWSSKFVSFAAGISVSLFLVPYVVELMGVTSKAGPSAFGFLAGFLGMMLMGKLWDHVSKTSLGEFLGSIFTRKQQ
jgi:hypothetical protein